MLPELVRLKREDCCDFDFSLCYRMEPFQKGMKQGGRGREGGKQIQIGYDYVHTSSLTQSGS